ncbi:MAG: sugar phosphate isomerase/epimerase [Candidatus Eremiobacteraeota bacterium]|nr:sugar phosphate isomerase/epimerase [Candidatus Eremiobacteraeota bacterium]
MGAEAGRPNKAYSFGISEFTTWPNTFEADVELYAESGADCIEVTQFKLDPARVAQQLQAVKDSGLSVSSVQATIHSLYPDGLAGEPTAPSDRVRHIRNAIEMIAPSVPAGTPFVAITGAAPGGDVEEVHATAVRAFRELARVCDAHGVRLAFEPLNPMLMNSDTAIWSLGDALDLVRMVDHAAFGLCVDAWNIWQTPNVADVIRQASDKIFLVQVSDYRRPRSHNDRVSIGDGIIPLASLVSQIRKTAYDGPYVLEIFSGESLPDSLWRADFANMLRRNMEGFASAWAQSEAL